MEGTKIKDLQVNQDLIGYYLVRESSLREGSNGSFLDLTLSDETGTVNAKIWKCDPLDGQKYTKGVLVKVMAKMIEYRGNLQMNINRIRPAQADDGVDIEDFVESAPLRSEDMYDQVVSYAGKIEDGDIRKIVQFFLTEYKTKLLYYPAAKTIHHAIRGGLLFHMLKMLETAEAIALVYPSLSGDLLFAGVILHDIEKVNEMESDRLGIAHYTMEGEMLGHLVMGARNVDRAARAMNIPEEKSILLQHIVISHHQRLEYGSPKVPMVVEAEVLHHIDMIDARIYGFNDALAGLKDGTMSDRVFALDNRKVYKVPREQNNE